MAPGSAGRARRQATEEGFNAGGSGLSSVLPPSEPDGLGHLQGGDIVSTHGADSSSSSQLSASGHLAPDVKPIVVVPELFTTKYWRRFTTSINRFVVASK